MLVLLCYTWSILIMIKVTFVVAAGNRLYFYLGQQEIDYTSVR